MQRINFFLLLLTLAVSSLQAKRALEPDDLYQLVFVEAPRIAPDESMVAFVQHSFDRQSDQREACIWVIRDSEPVQLTFGESRDTDPVWAPDSRSIYYLTDGQIARVDVESSEKEQLSELPSAAAGLSLSPDGNWLAFAMEVEEPLDLTFEHSGKAPVPYYTDQLDYQSDGHGLLSHAAVQLFVLPANGGKAVQLSRGGHRLHLRGHWGPHICWNAESNAVVWAIGSQDDCAMASELHLFGLEGESGQLTQLGGSCSWPAASPDGQWIAFAYNADERTFHNVNDLYLVRADGSELRCLTTSLDRSVNSLTWSVDSLQVYFQFDDQGNTKVAAIGLEGDMAVLEEQLGTQGTAYSGTIFGSRKYSVGADGRLVTVQTRSDHPCDLYLNGERLTAVNDALLEELELAKAEEVWFRSSYDGQPIQGWILKPAGFDPEGSYPLILEIHGGPIANYGNRFDFEKQRFGADGYVVFYCNPRGSTSYGRAFGYGIHHNYPGRDHDDLMSGVDHMLETGYIDPDSLFITGGSGGGCLTCWTIGKTHRFRAAVSLYPVVNWLSSTLSTDIPSYMLKYWFPAPPWEAPEHYWQRSPLSLVGHVITPTLLICGTEDRRTPLNDAQQYYTALKLQGVDAVLACFPEESHGCWTRPSHLNAKCQAILAWFNHHRRQEGPPVLQEKLWMPLPESSTPKTSP